MKCGKGSHLSATDVIRILLMGPKQGLVPTPHYCAIFLGESRRALLPVSYLIYSLKRHFNIQCNVSVLSSLQGQTVFKSSYGHLTSRGCFTFVQTLRILRMWVKSLRYSFISQSYIVFSFDSHPLVLHWLSCFFKPLTATAQHIILTTMSTIYCNKYIP